jgi:hypothetical protein
MVVADVRDPLRGSFSGREYPTITPKPFDREGKKQLFEGNNGSARIQARLIGTNVKFGTFDKKPACPILFGADFNAAFHHKSLVSQWARFKHAIITAGARVLEGDNPPADSVLRIVDFFPLLSRSHAESHKSIVDYARFSQYNVGRWWPNKNLVIDENFESQHKIHGILYGEDERQVVWTTQENAASASRLFDNLVFAIIIRYNEHQGFRLRVNITGMTYFRRQVIICSCIRRLFAYNTVEP